MFKNALIYQQLSKPGDYYLDDLTKKMSSRAYQPTRPTQPFSLGFYPPLEEDAPENPLSIRVADFYTFAIKTETRILPPSVVRDMLEERVKAIEHSTGRKVYKKDRQTIKDDLIVEVLPRCLLKHGLIRGYIDIKRNLIVLDATSTVVAEQCLSLIREIMGSYPVMPPVFNKRLDHTMTQWVTAHNTAPEGIAIGSDMYFREAGDASMTVHLKGDDVSEEVLESTLANGYMAEKLRIYVNNTVWLALSTDGWKLRALKFNVKPDLHDAEEAADRFTSELFYEASEIGMAFDVIAAAFGGFLQEQHLDL